MYIIRINPVVTLFFLLFSAASASCWGYTVDEENKIISVGAGETVAYSEISGYDAATYKINLADTAVVTHSSWIFNALTGTGTFRMAVAGDYDNPQKAMSNLTGFSGTVLLDASKARIRLRGSSYSTFSSEMTLDVSGNSQLWLNENLKCNVYLHDATGSYDGLGLIRFDGGSGRNISGNISISGNAGISTRVDGNTSTNTISGTITGVHAADSATKDNMTFGAKPQTANTVSTLVLTGNNSWNGATVIQYGTVELSGNGTLGSGTVTFLKDTSDIPDSKKTGETFKAQTAALAFNKTGDYEFTNAITGYGNIVKKGTGTVTLSGVQNGFTGTFDVQAGTLITKYAFGDSRIVGGVKLTGAGTFVMGGTAKAGDFHIDAYDLRGFTGTMEVPLGRTFNTRADLFGNTATMKFDDGSSLMFYTTTSETVCGDYETKFILAGNGHSEGRGVVRFHVGLSSDEQKKLNTAASVSLPNMAGDVTLAADSLIIGRVGIDAGWGMISGNISGNHTLSLNDSGKGWVALTGTNSYGDTVITNGTVQLGYNGVVNGKTYDGKSGTFGNGSLTVSSGATLDFRRTDRYTFSGPTFTNSGTLLVSDGEFAVTSATYQNGGMIQVQDGAVFTADANAGGRVFLNGTNAVANFTYKGVNFLAGTYTGNGTLNATFSGGITSLNVGNFSGFTGTLNLLSPTSSDGNNRMMLDGKTWNFGKGSVVIGSKSQIYMNGTTLYGNFRFGGSSAYAGDAGYTAAMRSDGTGTNSVYGSVTLTDDAAAISTRATSATNMYLYADVTGDGSLTKREDSNSTAGTLFIGKTVKDGVTYGGTVDYKGATYVNSGTLRLMNGVTMYAQDEITLGAAASGTFAGTSGKFVLEKGAVLSVGAKNAASGTDLVIRGTGTLTLDGAVALDVYSGTDYDTLTVNTDALAFSFGDGARVDVTLADTYEGGDSIIALTNGLGTDVWKDVALNLYSGGGYALSLSPTGELLLGSASALPEPSAYILILMGFTTLFFIRKKAL